MNEVFKVDDVLLSKALAIAEKSERKRFLILLHEQKEGERMTSMLNALIPGTYVQPHRHNDAYQVELFSVLKGRAAVLIFEDGGKIDIERSVILDRFREDLAIDIEPGVWHSVVPLHPSVLLEVKGQRNGYIQETDKEFSIWAPEEGTPAAKKYLEWLKGQITDRL